ncbi:MAG: phosphatidyl-myo-inositol alpha-mannosyltransferase [Actinomycetota bacterium]|nr:phosphatidyl-myo-inositol alpha-mannosyltransferase [Actinomycetota bacterium]
MRVLMVCPYSLTRPGGVQGQAIGLTRELRKLGIDVRLLGPCDGPPPGPGVISVGPSRNWENNGSIAPIAAGKIVARRTLDVHERLEPDIVHLHEPVVPGPTLALLVDRDAPTIGTFHISGDIGREWLLPAVHGRLDKLAARIAVSEAARETANRSYGPSDYDLLWNGVEVERFATAEPWPSRRPVVLFVGRHEPRKGLSVLLDAWDGIDRHAVLWVAGTGPETDALARRAVPGVEWVGSVTDGERNRRLRAATVFCAPAVGSESFGVVLIEAMAAGAAVVASRIDGYANVAREGREAILATPDDPIALRNALRQALDDAALRDRLVAAGRQRADELSMARLAEAYADLYEDSVKQR